MGLGREGERDRLVRVDGQGWYVGLNCAQANAGPADHPGAGVVSAGGAFHRPATVDMLPRSRKVLLVKL